MDAPAAPGAAGGPVAADPVAAARALLGEEAVAWVAALGAAVPRSGDPWLEPVAGMAAPPELDRGWDEPR